MDWVSRMEGKIWSDKKLFLLATSPGPRGGLGVFEGAAKSMPYQGANINGKFSLPSFYQNFNSDEGITNSELKEVFASELAQFEDSLNQSVTV